MTWIWLTLGSAIMLGLYDVTKKQALSKNGVLWILLVSSVFSTLFLAPFLSAGTLKEHLEILVKALLVTVSWISGLEAMKTLPLTTVSMLKASRPVFVVAFSIILFGERLSGWQWAGVLLIFISLLLLGRSSKKEGIEFTREKGFWMMILSILTGAASALYDKHIISGMEPLFLQGWSNFYISLLLALALIGSRFIDREGFRRFQWDWMLLLVSVLIVLADAFYFFALKQDGALLSVISMVRRCSVVVSFVVGAAIWGERRLMDKAIEFAVILVGLAILLFL